MVGRARVRAAAAGALLVNERIERSEIPFEEVAILDRSVELLARELDGRAHILNSERSMVEVAKAESKAEPSTTPPEERSVTELVKEALEQSSELIRLEVALAKNEVKTELADAKIAGMLLGAAAASAIIGAALLLVALSLAIAWSWVPSLVIGGVLVVLAAVLGAVGYRALPTRLMLRTRTRVEHEVTQLKERVAV